MDDISQVFVLMSFIKGCDLWSHSVPLYLCETFPACMLFGDATNPWAHRAAKGSQRLKLMHHLSSQTLQ